MLFMTLSVEIEPYPIFSIRTVSLSPEFTREIFIASTVILSPRYIITFISVPPPEATPTSLMRYVPKFSNPGIGVPLVAEEPCEALVSF